jgi:CRP-like cAMP-binding protein
VAGSTWFIRKLNAGEVLSHKGVQVDFLYVVLSGRLGLFADRGAGPFKYDIYGLFMRDDIVLSTL